jgi:DNA polymerase III epsilon subunit family exonuclease
LKDTPALTPTHDDSALDPAYAHAYQLLAEQTLVIVDTETTGLDPRVEQLLELGAVKLVKGQVTETFSALIKPTATIRPSSQKIHNISPAMVEDAPPIEDVLPRFLAFLGDLPYAAHNVAFDYGFIKEACKRNLGVKFNNLRVCTLEMYKCVFPEDPSHGLSSLASRFGEEAHVNHRALDDALQLAAVYPKLRHLYENKLKWQLSQLPNTPYLLERYVRLQKANQVIQSELADLKDLFKLYFAEGGVPLTASSGEQLTCQWRRHFEFDDDALLAAVIDAGLERKVCKVNVRTLDRLVTDRRVELTDEQWQALNTARKQVGQTLHVNVSKQVEVTTPAVPAQLAEVEAPLLLADDE